MANSTSTDAIKRYIHIHIHVHTNKYIYIYKSRLIFHIFWNGVSFNDINFVPGNLAAANSLITNGDDDFPCCILDVCELQLKPGRQIRRGGTFLKATNSASTKRRG